jgi:SAM-dependent methyltransferase
VTQDLADQDLPLESGYQPTARRIAQGLGDQDYLRQRLEPRPGDPFYLHLSDLLLGLRDLIPPGVSRVLDYGCGGSPYRSLFGSASYHRADLAGGANLDFEYGEDAELPRHVGGYDCVVSSQVLEHVTSPTAYLANCYRVLRPDGWLILSTHGAFEDHECPVDYWRWTASGLANLVQQAGFGVHKIKKLTTGPRAAMFILERELYRMNFSETGLYGRFLNYGAAVVRRAGARRRHVVCDRSFSENRAVEASEAGHDIYIAVIIAVRR